MTCLSCRHLVVEDRSEARLFVCGHDVESKIDSNDAATVIAVVPYSGAKVQTLQQRPVWCPLKTKEAT